MGGFLFSVLSFMLRFCDAFCGTGGFSLAAKQVFGDTAQCVWAIDHNREVSNTFKNNFGMDCYGDIQAIDPATIPDHDILFGGFPCQSFSRNGKWYNKNNKTIGESETRDALFLCLAAILRVKQPSHFVFENVPGLLSMKAKDGGQVFDHIQEELTIGCGYNIMWEVLNAADFGVPQQRKRVIIFGTHTNRGISFPPPTHERSSYAIKDVLEPKVASKYLLENIWANRKILLNHGKFSDSTKSSKKGPNHNYTMGASRYEVIKALYEESKHLHPTKNTGEIESVAILYGDTPSGLPRQQDKIYSIHGLSPTIATFSTPSVDAPDGLRMLTPRECARLQGFPDSYQLPSKDALAYKQVGNAVCIPMIAAVLRNLSIK
jgi:DNA (cytosine-5)-methyltransferase 1